MAVMRKDSRVFDLVNLDWYRSDTVANGDPGSSSTDLWQHFKCFYGSVCKARVSEVKEVLRDVNDEDD